MPKDRRVLFRTRVVSYYSNAGTVLLIQFIAVQSSGTII
jgi:hypothetical protein